jgi:hypothetical protein
MGNFLPNIDYLKKKKSPNILLQILFLFILYSPLFFVLETYLPGLHQKTLEHLQI